MQRTIKQDSYDHNQQCFCESPKQSSVEEFTDVGVTYRYCGDCGAERKDYCYGSQNSGESDFTKIKHIAIDNPELAKVRIKGGDHIAWTRYKGKFTFDHHAIVVETRPDENLLRIIHYAKEFNSDWKRKIHCKWYDFNSFEDMNYGKLFCVEYPAELIVENPPSVVIKRALLRLNERSYNLLWNNCESFATFCKRGVARSLQVSKRVCSILREVGGVLLEVARTPRMLVWGAEFIGSEGVESAARLGAQHVTHANMIGGVIYLVAEGIFCCVNIYQLYGARHDRGIGKDEFRKAVVKRIILAVSSGIVGATSSVVGGMVGSAVGAFIAGPIGAGVGLFAGSVLGGVGGVATLNGSRTILWSLTNSEDIVSIHELNIGDHVVLSSTNKFHPRCHAIVSAINTATSVIEIIRNKYKEGVVQEWIYFKKMKRIKYSLGECY